RPEQRVDGVAGGDLALRQRPDLQHLPRVVPLVERLVGVDALVTLQPDEPAAEDAGEHLGRLGLAHPDLAFEQDRARQRHRQEQRGRQAAVGEVTALTQEVRQRTDGPGLVGQVSPLPGVSGSACCEAVGQPCLAGPSTRSATVPPLLSLPSRSSRSRQAARRSSSAPSTSPNPTSAIRLQDFPVPMSSRSALVCPWALQIPRSTSSASSGSPLIYASSRPAPLSQLDCSSCPEPQRAPINGFLIGGRRPRPS